MQCNCNICKERTLLIALGVPATILERMDHESVELNYLRLVINGTWPNAVEVLTEALAKAKALREEGLLKTPTYH